MRTKSLKFRATARWVLEGAQEKIQKETEASATIHYPDPSINAGTLRIEASEEDKIEKAVTLLRNDSLYSQHFFNE